MIRALLLLAVCALLCGCDQTSGGEDASTTTNGARLYELHCASCHGPDGQGHVGLQPPLAGAEWTNGESRRLSALMLDGLQGEVEVKGAKYRGIMPSWKIVLSDAQIASVLSYVRQSWGNHALEISAMDVSIVRHETAQRNAFWTAEELRATPPTY